MSIVCIREGYTGHEAGGEADSKTATRHFSLVTDTVSDDARFSWPQADVVDPTIIIPAPGTYYPGHTDIRSKEPHVRKVSPCFFNVEVRYGEDIDKTGKRGDDKWAANPLNKPAEITWEARYSNEPSNEDVNGVPYVNSFNEIVTGVEREVADIALHIRRNEAIFVPVNIYNWTHTIYDGVFRDQPKGRTLMNDIQVEDVYDEDEESEDFGELLYCKVSYEILFRIRPTPLVNAYELKKKISANTKWGFYPIINNEEKQDYYAWFDRTAHKATQYRDGDGNIQDFKNDDPHCIRVISQIPVAYDPATESDTIIYGDIPDFVFQQRYPFATWPGVA